MSRTATFILALAAFIAGFSVATLRQPCGSEMTDIRTDTVIRIDTVRIISPAPVSIRPKATVQARMATVTDTVRDTVTVEVPVTTTEYAGEGYRAYVSGWQPRLDSLVLLQPVATVRVPQAGRRWAIGLQTGIGITPSGIQPYIGIGMTLTL